MAKKLDGIRVVDLSMFLPGPFLTMMMADHGAEVIRIDYPELGEHSEEILADLGYAEAEISALKRQGVV